MIILMCKVESAQVHASATHAHFKSIDSSARSSYIRIMLLLRARMHDVRSDEHDVRSDALITDLVAK